MLVFLVILLSCASTPQVPVSMVSTVEAIASEPAPDVPVNLYRLSLEGVSAVFLGERVPTGIEARMGIRGIRFEFDSGEVVPFVPRGEVYFSDWSFEIASPDGQWLLLPQDRYGPYHVIGVSRLAEYLAGGDPDHTLQQVPDDPSYGAWIHEGGTWVSDSEVEYRAGLSDRVDTYRFSLN